MFIIKFFKRGRGEFIVLNIKVCYRFQDRYLRRVGVFHQRRNKVQLHAIIALMVGKIQCPVTILNIDIVPLHELGLLPCSLPSGSLDAAAINIITTDTVSLHYNALSENHD